MVAKVNLVTKRRLKRTADYSRPSCSKKIKFGTSTKMDEDISYGSNIAAIVLSDEDLKVEVDNLIQSLQVVTITQLN